VGIPASAILIDKTFMFKTWTLYWEGLLGGISVPFWGLCWIGTMGQPHKTAVSCS
jgi:hypothetical protein